MKLLLYYKCSSKIGKKSLKYTIGILVGEKRINKEHPIKDVLVLKWPTSNFNLKILFSKKFSDWQNGIVIYVKLKVL